MFLETLFGKNAYIFGKLKFLSQKNAPEQIFNLVNKQGWEFALSLFSLSLSSLFKKSDRERIALNKKQNDKRTSVSKSLSVSLKKSDISD